jgi:hypothetical protein
MFEYCQLLLEQPLLSTMWMISHCCQRAEVEQLFYDADKATDSIVPQMQQSASVAPLAPTAAPRIGSWRLLGAALVTQRLSLVALREPSHVSIWLPHSRCCRHALTACDHGCQQRVH